MNRKKKMNWKKKKSTKKKKKEEANGLRRGFVGDQLENKDEEYNDDYDGEENRQSPQQQEEIPQPDQTPRKNHFNRNKQKTLKQCLQMHMSLLLHRSW
ncbi:unnamed protein product [Microthlaspi erraticum]|uniref:Uncharacterized protein n=1 Tax=Microthlaspi erraticum TaxID=1685480 RepID=A0A6D2KNY5_9BRAS|nr:unnamed protein product [Microthlaspi erraticum]